ncbi:hypothetical protein J1605_013939 [Eschrichtius robustus]|uniref:C2H2-type domain-containing protein n=1 Tax=Eschrichtius robustus TaxID=9764 RepID=A0AB34GEH6_ESCRO|nr:hypothetical protein J1605_013939 [Eschrichtius robustus]
MGQIHVLILSNERDARDSLRSLKAAVMKQPKADRAHLPVSVGAPARLRPVPARPPPRARFLFRLRPPRAAPSVVVGALHVCESSLDRSGGSRVLLPQTITQSVWRSSSVVALSHSRLSVPTLHVYVPAPFISPLDHLSDQPSAPAFPRRGPHASPEASAVPADVSQKTAPFLSLEDFVAPYLAASLAWNSGVSRGLWGGRDPRFRKCGGAPRASLSSQAYARDEVTGPEPCSEGLRVWPWAGAAGIYDTCGTVLSCHSCSLLPRRSHGNQGLRAFPMRPDLLRHQRNYRSEQSFGCEVCGQAFSLRGRLGPHRQVCSERSLTRVATAGRPPAHVHPVRQGSAGPRASAPSGAAAGRASATWAS